MCAQHTQKRTGLVVVSEEEECAKGMGGWIEGENAKEKTLEANPRGTVVRTLIRKHWAIFNGKCSISTS